MSTYLYLFRHGETVMNESKVYYGATDCQLSERGIEQVIELNKILKEKFDVVISSPLIRAIDTAKIISGLTLDEIVIDKGLREIDFGLWEGLHFNEISTRYEKEWNNWIKDWKGVAPPQGESFQSQYTRVKKSLNKILTEYKGKRVMIVSHQGCLRIIASILLIMEERAYWNFNFEHGTYSLFEIIDGHSTIRK